MYSEKEHIERAELNLDFHDCLVEEFESEFYEWRSTALFYVSLHYLKGLGSKKRIDLGNSHESIRKCCCPKSNPGARMPITNTAWNNYHALKIYSEEGRYDGVSDLKLHEEIMRGNYADACQRFEDFKKYVCAQGLAILT